MHYVVWVKMVPDTTQVTIDPVTNTLVRSVSAAETATKASVFGVACPYGMTMFEDGLKDEKASEQVAERLA